MEMKNAMGIRALAFLNGLTGQWNETAFRGPLDTDILEYRHGGQTPLLATLSLGLYPQAAWLVKKGADITVSDNQGNGVVYRLLKDDTPTAHVFFDRHIATLPCVVERNASCEGVFDRLWDLALQGRVENAYEWLQRLTAVGIYPPPIIQSEPTLIWMVEQVARAMSAPPWNSERNKKEAFVWQEILDLCMPHLDLDAVDLRGWQVEDVLLRRSAHVPAEVRQRLVGLISSTREHLRLHQDTKDSSSAGKARRL
jgi:hypothetical protein